MRFTVLGPMQVIDGDRDVPVTRRRVRELITTLAAAQTMAVQTELGAGGYVEPEKLAELIWGDPSQLQSMRQHIWLVYNSLGKTRVRLQQPYGYQLVLDSTEDLDLNRFLRSARQGHTAADRGDSQQAVEHFEQTLALWPDDQALHDFPDTPQMRAQITNKLRETYVTARQAYFEHRIALGAYRAVLPGLKELNNQQPLDERWWSLLILARFSEGGRDSALREFTRAQAMLSSKGRPLSEDLLVLRDRIINGDTELAPSGPTRAVELSPTPVVPRAPADTENGPPGLRQNSAELVAGEQTRDRLPQEPHAEPNLTAELRGQLRAAEGRLADVVRERGIQIEELTRLRHDRQTALEERDAAHVHAKGVEAELEVTRRALDQARVDAERKDGEHRQALAATDTESARLSDLVARLRTDVRVAETERDAARAAQRTAEEWTATVFSALTTKPPTTTTDHTEAAPATDDDDTQGPATQTGR